MEDENLHTPDKLCHFATKLAHGLRLDRFKLGRVNLGNSRASDIRVLRS